MAVTEAVDAARRQADEYRGDAERPLGGYLTVMAVYGLLVATAAISVTLTGRSLPERWTVQDLATVAIGGHKLARLLSKDAVTSPLRVPVARFEESGAPAEVNESPRKSSGVRHSLGELITCPFCLDMWVVTGFVIGLVCAPRVTRLVAGTFTALGCADFLQFAYARAQQCIQ
ncbi:DUF1360 domain-containing protein [Tomitella gaofuii]|uniref:DUF1360 domain-containing protein n=1 Tax=Tomitella gaofuii TaxID=2760083 RepID=UPI0015FC440B|nr:DUF1360 domain-containing protein [Tomitella gaofuii]